jgi:hypothetical protein
MATPNGEYKSAKKTPHTSRVIVSQYIAEPDLPKRTGGAGDGPNTGASGLVEFSCISCSRKIVYTDKLSSVAKTSWMQKQNTPGTSAPLDDIKSPISAALSGGLWQFLQR